MIEKLEFYLKGFYVITTQIMFVQTIKVLFPFCISLYVMKTILTQKLHTMSILNDVQICIRNLSFLLRHKFPLRGVLNWVSVCNQM